VHGDDEGMIGDFGEDVSFGKDIFDVGYFAFEEAFGDDFHGEDLGGVAVADLEHFAEGSHANDSEEFEVFGGYEAFALLVVFAVFFVIAGSGVRGIIAAVFGGRFDRKTRRFLRRFFVFLDSLFRFGLLVDGERMVEFFGEFTHFLD